MLNDNAGTKGVTIEMRRVMALGVLSCIVSVAMKDSVVLPAYILKWESKACIIE